jgi:hypothetical protein
MNCPRCKAAIILQPVKKKNAPVPEVPPAEESQAPTTGAASWTQPDENVSYYEERTEPQEWFYKELGKERGPVSFETLVRLAAENEIGPETRVRRSDSQDWVIAVKVPGLFGKRGDGARKGAKPG